MKMPSLAPVLPLAALFAIGFSLQETASAATPKSQSKQGSAKQEQKKTNLEATLEINPREVAPATTIELRFPTPMIDKEHVGETAAESPLMVEPALSGDFEWTSTRSGLYHLTQPPQFNTTYKFRLRAGLADLEGTPLATAILDQVGSANFSIIDQYPKWINSDDTKRAPSFLFEFNDSVNPSEAAKSMVFSCGENNARIPAKARHATGRDYDKFYAEPEATWAEMVSDVEPEVTPDGARLSALVVEPETPLTVGKKWSLEIATTLPNMSGRDKLAAGDSISLGEVKPFLATHISAHTPFDEVYYTSIIFNKRLPGYGDTEPIKKKEDLVKMVRDAIKIEPPVEITHVDVDYRSVSLHGKFALHQTYTITVNPGLKSDDGLDLQAVATNTVTFIPNAAYVAVPSFINAQLAAGEGNFEFIAANVKQVRVRAKRLNGPELLEAMEKYKTYESTFYGAVKQRKDFAPESFEAYPGTPIYDRSFPVTKPIDQSELLSLNWKEVLGASTTGPMFVEFEGAAMEGTGDKNVIAQTLVTFTDLGLMQKANGKESMVFVTSLKSGMPIAGVRLTMADEERRLIGYADTDAAGIAVLSGKDPYYVIAEKGKDCTAMTLERYGIPMWHFGVATAWRSPWNALRRTFVFADRPVYKPGETAHIKAHTRQLVGDDLRLDAAPVKARVVLRDPRYRVVMDKAVTFSGNGAWNDDLTLPEGPTGWYNLSLQFEHADDDDEDQDESGGYLSFRIDEYRPNTFEIHLDGGKADMQPDRIKVPLSANYYMGKPLSHAKVVWNAWRLDDYQPPETYADYHFGDAPTWSRYGLDRDADSDRDDGPQSWDANGDLTLNEDGTAELEMPSPPEDRASMPQRIHVEAEITDINQQTITGRAEFTVPGAEFILGLKGPEFYGTAGKDLPLDLIAVTPDGAPQQGPVDVEVKIERQSYHTLKVATAGGGFTTRDQVVLQQELLQSVTLASKAAGQPATAPLTFKPAHGGAYFMTATATDSKGRKLLSRMPFYVLGGGEFPWAMEDGNRMNLQPDKTTLKPGEEATIVVKTPIAGTALVTVERNKVHKQFITALSPDNPIIKVPVQDEESPNVFVSVIVIRGADASPKKQKMPEYRIGYCELKVDSNAHELAVEVKPDRETVKPGETLTITGAVRDAKGNPSIGSDVTLYAVDEGVLSLMSYQTPNPSPFFHSPFALAIKTWSSLEDILPEDAEERERGNKGFLVGGGGEDEFSDADVRKNFKATALWLGSVTTDAKGAVSATVTAPDNLTRYRIMAVAAADADRFGSGQSAFTVQKPLMIEPAVPRFARLGDEVLVKAIVHNTTPHSGEVEVELKLDETSSFIVEERPFIPASLQHNSAVASGKVDKRTLAIKAGETLSLAFPVRFEKLGSADWTWTVHTTNWPQPEGALNDGTISTFEVNHPVSPMREVRYVRLDAKTPVENLLKDMSPELLEGEGSVQINVSNSRLMEAQDALDYVLHYPYGCVEQTSSSTLPWLALSGFNKLFPDQLNPANTKAAIQAGANRLLRMVTDQGGLAYWPGGQEPSLWGSAYGGFVLLKARDMGALVPDEVIDGLLDYLSKELRNLDTEKNSYVMSDCALALYTLAKGGRAEPAYQNLLYERRERMSEMGRLELALAMLVSKAPEDQVKTLLGWKPKPAPAKGDAKKAVAKASPAKKAATPAPVETHWLGNRINLALKLIAYTHLGLTEDADAMATQVLQSRDSHGSWGNTFTNAWMLMAMAAYERSNKNLSTPLDMIATWGEDKVPLNLTPEQPVSEVAFALDQAHSASPLALTLPENRTVLARIEAKSWPKSREFAGENKGYAISRTYEKVSSEGDIKPAENLRVGDMVLVTLDIEIAGGDRYLAINDPLPAVFEAINPDFDTQASRSGDKSPAGFEPWFCDYREIRADRALFFTDYAPDKGKFSLSYLARVIAEGETIAPPARIEAMYQPDRYGLSATQRISTLPSASGKNVAGN